MEIKYNTRREMRRNREALCYVAVLNAQQEAGNGA